MDRTNPGFSLLEAARIVARGPELDTKLDALCGHVLSAAGATAAVIYLLDPVANVLVPAAQAGMRGKMITAHAEVSVDDPNELVAQVVRERRQMNVAGEDAQKVFTGQDINWQGVVAVPLVAADEAGGEDAEGVLLAAYDVATPPDGSDDMLTALADLSAVAIRQARLQRALLERADAAYRKANGHSMSAAALAGFSGAWALFRHVLPDASSMRPAPGRRSSIHSAAVARWSTSRASMSAPALRSRSTTWRGEPEGSLVMQAALDPVVAPVFGTRPGTT